MSKKKEILDQIGVYLSGTLVTQFITLCVALITRRFLGPLHIGIWTLLQVIKQYANYSTLGVIAASGREIPFHVGKKDMQGAQNIKDVLFTFGLFTSLVTSVGLISFAVWSRQTLSIEMFWGLCILAALLILERMNNIQLTLLRAHKKFKLAAKQMVLSAIVNAVFMTILSYNFKIYGYMLGLVLSIIFNIIYVFYNEKFDFRLYFNKKIFQGLIAYGFPLLIISLITTTLMSIDRLMVARFLGLEALGLYSIAILASSFLARVPNAIGIVLIPNFHEKYGENERIADLKKYVMKSSEMFGFLMPIIIGLTWIVCPVAIMLVVPNFVESTASVRWLILGSFFLSMAYPFHTFIIAMKKHWYLVPLLAIACLISGMANYTAIQFGYGIVGVAVAVMIVLGFKFTMNFIIAAKYLFTFYESCLLYGKIICQFFMLMALLFVLEKHIVLNNDYFSLSIKMLLFLLFYLPSIFRVNREYELVTLLRSKFLRKKQYEGILVK